LSVLQHFKGYEALLSRLQDAIVLMEKRNNVIITPFFSPDQLMIAKSYLGKQYQYEIFGGYEGCERAKIAILPFPQDIAFKITILYAKLSSR
jgi:RNA-binding protein YlmH